MGRSGEPGHLGHANRGAPAFRAATSRPRSQLSSPSSSTCHKLPLLTLVRYVALAWRARERVRGRRGRDTRAARQLEKGRRVTQGETPAPASYGGGSPVQAQRL